MKTLKFMLAAATAIGLATASQADTKPVGTDLGGSPVDFESMDVGDLVTGETAGFSYTGDDNDSAVVAGGAQSTAKALQVSVGTNPLLRALDWRSDAAQTVQLSGSESVDIDTYVQFTVTPFADSVETNAGDKLMIYLKEMTNGVGTITGTNLMVKAAEYRPGDGLIILEPTLTPMDVSVTNVTVEPGEWYNLKVKAQLDGNGVMYFSIYLGGAQLGCGRDLYPEDGDGFKFPSLLGDVASLQYVGFAGEGKVDELVFTKTTLISSVDFTLTLNANVSSVPYSINGDAQTPASATVTVQVYPEDVITVGSVSYAAGYIAAADSPVASGFTSTQDGYTVGETACSLTFSAALNSLDFTLALGTGVSAVEYTLDGGTTTQTVTSASNALNANPGSTMLITGVSYANWYIATGTYVAGYSFTPAADATYTVEASKTAADPDPTTGEVVINNNTTPADIGITEGAFVGESAGSASLSKVVKWATNNTKGNKGAGAIAAINAMTFIAGSETQTEKAYLFNVADNAAAVADAEAAFKFDAIDTSDLPPNVSGATDVNGTVTIQGATTLGDWHTATENDKFFRATLTK